MIGDKYGRLTILEFLDENKLCKCLCECGGSYIGSTVDVKRGHTRSCGCLQKETVTSMATRHGLRSHRLYSIRASMITRCYNSNSSGYANYGGRGISICDEWLDSKNGMINFYNWAIKNGYSEELSLDRKDVNGNYEPGNCQWSNRVVQANNTRTTEYIEINGEVKSVSEWRKNFNLSRSTYKWRKSKGWDTLKALTTPAKNTGRNSC